MRFCLQTSLIILIIEIRVIYLTKTKGVVLDKSTIYRFIVFENIVLLLVNLIYNFIMGLPGDH